MRCKKRIWIYFILFINVSYLYPQGYSYNINDTILKNHLYFNSGSLFLVLFQGELCYERNILNKEINLFQNRINFDYWLNIKPTIGIQGANPIFDTNWGNCFSFSLSSQFSSSWEKYGYFYTKGVEIGGIFYQFYNGDFFEGVDLIPVLYYTQNLYLEDMFIKLSLGVPNSIGFGFGLNF